MRRAWPILAACGFAALAAAQPASAACASWRVAPELSLRHADGWTMLQLSQHGARLSGSARRSAAGSGQAEAAGSVQGRLDGQRLWLKVSWPGGSEIFDGAIGPNGNTSGTRISAQGHQDGAAWEAIEPLECLASAPGPAAGGGPSGGEPSLDDFTRAARDIIGILRGDQAQSEPAPAQSSPAPSSSAGSDDPFGPPPAADGEGSSDDPFGAPPVSPGGQADDPLGSSPASSGAGGSDPFGAPPASSGGSESSGGSGGSAPPMTEYGQIEVPKSGAKSMPMILLPIGPIDDTCASGFVWREARPSDHVCVPPAARDRVKGENFFARSNRDSEGLYGCKAGSVWREAWAGDRTCVSPAARDLAAEENRLGPQRKASK